METVKVSWSGGKDSTCALSLHLEAGHKVKAVCYIPMLTYDIPLILKNHYNFILSTAEHFCKTGGADVHIVTGITYVDFVHKVSSRTGKIFGFPCFLTSKCSFKRDSKEKALKQCDVGYFDYEDIGIAFDEIKRKGQLTQTKRSILCEQEYTEVDALQYCKNHGMLSPHYETSFRDGCALCPNAKAKERKLYFQDYPDAFDIVLDLQNFVKNEILLGHKPENHTPLRNYKWFIEENHQPSLFSNETKFIIN